MAASSYRSIRRLQVTLNRVRVCAVPARGSWMGAPSVGPADTSRKSGEEERLSVSTQGSASENSRPQAPKRRMRRCKPRAPRVECDALSPSFVCRCPCFGNLEPQSVVCDAASPGLHASNATLAAQGLLVGGVWVGARRFRRGRLRPCRRPRTS